jgi:hypothetical protein
MSGGVPAISAACAPSPHLPIHPLLSEVSHLVTSFPQTGQFRAGCRSLLTDDTGWCNTQRAILDVHQMSGTWWLRTCVRQHPHALQQHG